jgi:hypothetical protein
LRCVGRCCQRWLLLLVLPDLQPASKGQVGGGWRGCSSCADATAWPANNRPVAPQ